MRQYRDTRPYRTQGLLRPTNDNFRDGKIEVIVDFTDPNRASNDLIAIVARVNPTQTANQYDYYEIVFDQ
ncbi:MAG: hypothetical protein LBD11_08595 [Candidatus Peribacteria bacterium]|nr:hypothetical protein [Candidatus Peribacteria bacterium]